MFLLWCLLFFLPVGAQAQELGVDRAEEAEFHFKRAIERYRRGDLTGALEHLLRSNRLAPNRNVVFNIARTFEQLGQDREAYRHYADYLMVAEPSTQRDEAESALSRLAAKVALVEIRSAPAGASVYVGRRELGVRGATPIVLALEPGEHEFILELDGHFTSRLKADLSVGRTITLNAPLDAITGEVRLTGEPAGAVVRNSFGALLGRLPVTLELPPGPHELKVESEGYRSRLVNVDVVRDALVQVEIDLSVRTGRAVVDALERGARIEVDGVAAGFTPAVLDLPIGEHEIVVRMDGFRPERFPVSLGEEDVVEIQARLRTLQEVRAASRAAESVEEAPASVSVITREEIRAFGYQSLYEALQGLRGVYPTNDRTYASLGMRGFARPGDYGNRMLVTLDGHTMNEDQIGGSFYGADFSSDLLDVSQIELVRGPGSALYGTNAFLGVVNVVTAGRDDIPKPHAALSSDVARTARLRAGTGFGNRDLGGWLSVSGLASQGQDFYFPELDDRATGGTNTGRVDGADGSRALTTATRLWWKDLTVQGWFNTAQQRFATGAYDTIPGDPRASVQDMRGFGEVRWEPSFGDKVKLFSRAWVDGSGFQGQYPYEDTLIQDSWRSVWMGVEPRLVVQPLSWLTFTGGAEVRAALFSVLRGEDSDEVYLQETPLQQVYAGYLTADLRAGRWMRASLGGRYDHFSLGGFGGAFNPRGSLVFFPTERDVVKVLAGTAFRAPSPYELFYNDGGLTQVSPVGLQPERIFTAEAEYSHRFGDVVHLTFSGWYNELSSLIDVGPRPSDGLFVFGNYDDRVRALGAEWELRRDWRQGWMVAAQQSWAWARTGSLLTGDPVTNAPLQLFGFKGAAPLVPALAVASTRVLVESPRRRVDGELTPWVVWWDLTLTAKVPSMPVELAAGVRNALDWRAYHPGGFAMRQPMLPQPGRAMFARVVITP